MSTNYPPHNIPTYSEVCPALGTPTPTFSPFQFVLPSGCARGRCAWEAGYQQFAEWQNGTIQGIVAAPEVCKGAKVVVFRPSAGLGDSLLAMVTALQMAMKTGRLFFVDWDLVRVGLAPPQAQGGGGLSELGTGSDSPRASLVSPAQASAGTGVVTPWQWDWPTFPCRQVLSSSAEASHLVAIIRGSITADHWLMKEVPVAAARWYAAQAPKDATRGGSDEDSQSPPPVSQALVASYEDHTPRRWLLTRQVVRPSDEVRAVLAPALKQLGTAALVVGLQIRTGWDDVAEPKPFLKEGDQYLFVDCFRELMRRRGADVDSTRVVVVTDSDRVRSQIRRELGDVVVVSGWDAPLEHTFRRPSTNGILKAFSDLFLLGYADVAILTNWSLFGRAAAEVSPVLADDESGRVYINSAVCGIAGQMPCIEPWPPSHCPSLKRRDSGHDEL